MSDFDITNTEVFCFDFEEECFKVIYEDNVWYAISEKDELDEEKLIIEDPSNNIFMTEDIELFEGFVFLVELFNQYKAIVLESKNNNKLILE